MKMNKMQKALIGTSIVGSVLGAGAFGVTMIGAASAATNAPGATSTSAPSATHDTDGTRDADGTRHRMGPPAGNGPQHDGWQHDGPQHDPSKGGHVGRNGTAEALLTGDTAARVKAAVLAQYPKATIQRVENDAEGAVYEAHIVQADGSRATVKLNASFTVTSTETGR